jgi:hypothetical protein
LIPAGYNKEEVGGGRELEKCILGSWGKVQICSVGEFGMLTKRRKGIERNPYLHFEKQNVTSIVWLF